MEWLMNLNKAIEYIENNLDKEISNDEILDRLKEIIPMIRPNLEKFDKSKYPSFDSALFQKRK